MNQYTLGVKMCPFCGAEPKINKRDFINDSSEHVNYVMITCASKTCILNKNESETDAEAIYKWNDRA